MKTPTQEMTIHERINAKANNNPTPSHFYADRERHGESIEGYARSRSRMIRNGYDKLYYITGRLLYPQDQKTNYREPREPDGEDFRGKEAANFERERMREAQKLK